MTVELVISISTQTSTCPPGERVSFLVMRRQLYSFYLPERFDFLGQDQGIAAVYVVCFHTEDVPQLDGVELTIV